MPKLSPDLCRRLSTTPQGHAVEVVVEVGSKRGSSILSKSADRAQKIAARKQDFAANAEPIEQAIAHYGGEVLDRAWLNQSLKVRLPREGVEALGEREDVVLVDTPRSLRAD